MWLIQRLSAIFAISLSSAVLAQQKPPDYILEPFHYLYDPFYEGCCVIPSIRPPKNLSQATVPRSKLLKALNCATNNDFVGGTLKLAKHLGDRTSLNVSYYYGSYMDDKPWLTVAAYAVKGRQGVLFDVYCDRSGCGIPNLPPLRRTSKQWQVGEIYGGLWSYTRVWYLAQEIGSRPRMTIPVAEIQRTKPSSCSVFASEETRWKAKD